MIVKMKKISLVVLDSEVRESMEKLRDAGIMHLNLTDPEGENYSELVRKKTIIEKSIAVLPATEEEKLAVSKDTNTVFEIANKVNELSHKQFICHEETLHIEREIQKTYPWGDFSYNDIKSLRDANIDIRLYELTIDQFNKIPGDVKVFVVNRTRSIIRIAAVFTDEKNAGLPYEEASLHEKSLSELESLFKEKKNEIEFIQRELNALSPYRNSQKNTLEDIDRLLEFEHAVSNMSKDGKLAYLTGYTPEKEAGNLRKIASKNGWGLMINDPSDEDSVPTLVENPKFIRAISPVFKLLGTIPGYKEYDISIWFLIFFSIFWSMIIGDAGYGLLFLLFAIIGRIKFKKAPHEIFLLLFITSITTIIWGSLTGTWFGAEALSKNKFLSRMIIPSIASFSAEGNEANNIIMNMCFLLGAVQLSIAHILNFFRFLPSLKAFAEMGRLSLIWAIFLLIRYLVLKIEIPSAFMWMLCAGLFLIIIFSEQNGSFFKGVKAGFANLIFIALNSIGFLSDIVSYLRLFAVGLASLEVARSFNEMALSLGSNVFAVIGTVLILFFAHSLNMTLSVMSLIVHGVRLNMLEFSGHLNMEWSGFTFKPFKKR